MQSLSSSTLKQSNHKIALDKFVANKHYQKQKTARTSSDSSSSLFLFCVVVCVLFLETMISLSPFHLLLLTCCFSHLCICACICLCSKSHLLILSFFFVVRFLLSLFFFSTIVYWKKKRKRRRLPKISSSNFSQTNILNMHEWKTAPKRIHLFQSLPNAFLHFYVSSLVFPTRIYPACQSTQNTYPAQDWKKNKNKVNSSSSFIIKTSSSSSSHRIHRIPRIHQQKNPSKNQKRNEKEKEVVKQFRLWHVCLCICRRCFFPSHFCVSFFCACGFTNVLRKVDTLHIYTPNRSPFFSLRFSSQLRFFTLVLTNMHTLLLDCFLLHLSLPFLFFLVNCFVWIQKI